MKKLIVFAMIATLCIALIGCCALSNGTWPPKSWNHKDFGSFSPETTYSFDEKYYAVQSLTRTEGSNANCILLTIYDAETDAEIAAYALERASDFWGVCWEKDSYNIWVQSADTGTYCLRFDGEGWLRDSHAVLPEYIIDRYKMRNDSFRKSLIYSADGRYAAAESFGKIIIWDASAVTPSEDGGYSIDTSVEPLLSYSLNEKQQRNYRGLCWEGDAPNLWMRFGDDVYCLAYTENGWAWKDDVECPESIVLKYNWDGSAA